MNYALFLFAGCSCKNTNNSGIIATLEEKLAEKRGDSGKSGKVPFVKFVVEQPGWGNFISGLLIELSGLLIELSGLLTELSGLLIELSGLLTELSGLLTELSGLLTELSGLLIELSGLLTEICCNF